MFSRLSQLTRHLSRPLPNYAHQSANSTSAKAAVFGVMTSSRASADERSRRTIHTAGCIIIGDEVLGGKVCSGRHLLDYGEACDANVGIDG